MQKLNHPIEKHVQTITYNGIEFQVVERPDVLWVGCVDYAKNNTDQSDIGATQKRFFEVLIDVAKNDLINPGYGASISINYGCDDKPCGLMIAEETYSDKQDERFDLFTQPGGLWLRIHITDETDTALLGRKNHGIWEYYAENILVNAAEENGYKTNPDIHVGVEYDCHAGPEAFYVYIPIIAV